MTTSTTGVTLRAERGRGKTAGVDTLLVPVVEGSKWVKTVAAFAPGAARAIERRAKAVDFRGRPEDTLVHHTDKLSLVLLGLGQGELAAERWRRAGARGRREADRQGGGKVLATFGDGTSAHGLTAFVEGFLLAGYRFDRYREAPKTPGVSALTLAGGAIPAPKEARELLADVESVVRQVAAARDLVNEPPSVATPRFLADHARTLAKEIRGLEAEVWEPSRIVKEGLAGVMAVARGSHEAPRFVMLRWKPKNARQHVALVGKGITFDSGGLSLKPAKSMETMKYDMAGGSAVLGAAAAVAALELPVAVTAYVPATENLPGGGAQKPGDVIRYANGKTVEVLNTDAEGRLVLADALVVAAKEKPDAIIDLATLTGAARVALGSLYACVVGTDQPLIDALIAAGQAAGEPLWQLPLVQEYRDDIRSPIADMKNVGAGGEAGTIIGGLFLREFVGDVPWAHLDIAGPAFAERDLAIAPRGATGYGVRLLVEYVRRLAGV
jgi:leucyl aminopeptidase